MGNTPKKKTVKKTEPAVTTGPTPAGEWKGRQSLAGQDLPLPSGNVARVRNIAPEAFFASGFMPDSLTQLVREAINKKSGLPPAKVQQIAGDPKKVAEAMETFNRVLVYCVVEPSIEPVPGCGEFFGPEDDRTQCNRDPNEAVHTNREVVGFHKFIMSGRDANTLYADEVDLEDKMFIFQWALGGVSDLEAFRKQQRAAVESAQHGKAVRSPAKRAARSN